jgi:hypothetical protein
MMPNAIPQLLNADSQLTTLLGSGTRIAESYSWGTPLLPRPTDGYWLSITFEEMSMSAVSALAKGPRILTIAVHHPWEIDRDISTLISILNRVDEILLPIEQVKGTDGIRITEVKRRGRSRPAHDEGWQTITATTVYGVLYDEFAA